MNIRQLVEMANKPIDTAQKQEDGTVADLGIVPTGHKLNSDKREPYHSLDIHDDKDEDDGW